MPMQFLGKDVRNERKYVGMIKVVLYEQLLHSATLDTDYLDSI